MDNPYRPPDTQVRAAASGHRIGHSLVALLAGVFLYPALAIAFGHWHYGAYPTAYENAALWGTGVVGGVIAAVAVFRHKRIPLWLTALCGFAVTTLLVLVPGIWGGQPA